MRRARTRPRRRFRSWGAALALGLLLAPADVAGQAGQETRLLRQAAALESRGDFDGAERTLRRLLEEHPSSSGGLFALERVLRAKGEPRALLPVVDAFLEQAPASPGVRYLKLRVLVEVDSLEAIEAAAEAWFALDPREEAPYRDVSRIYERAFGPERALDVLRRGRRAVGGDNVLAMELGDLLSTVGDVDGAVDEWARAVGADGGQAGTVARRVAALQGDEAPARRLVETLGASSEPARRRAGASIAVDLGLEAEAMALSRRVAAELGGRPRASFLADIARRGREGGLSELAAWAYGELGEGAGSPGERRQFDQRLVEASLAVGDTAAALEAQRRVADSFTPGSVDRRRATAQVIRLEAAGSDPDRLRALLADFREAFPRAPELDDLGATVAAGLLARDDPAGAAAVLDGIDGPRSSLERGYLLMAGGDVALGRQALLMAVPGLLPTDATEVIQFAGLLGRLSPPGVTLLAEAGVLAHRGRGAEAAAAVAEGVAALPEEERAPLLAEAARMAVRSGAETEAAALRRGLLRDHPEAPEGAEAALELARWEAAREGGTAEAIRLLERLIVERPTAAVVPTARRELEKLRERGS